MGVIAIGGLITFISHALHLDTKLAIFVPIADNTALDIHSCEAQHMIKYKSAEMYHLMINNALVWSVVLPCPTHTDVQVKAN